jgi:EAL domain-containing protein (putative c-di-GMP-specific phosphodiesterase class I)
MGYEATVCGRQGESAPALFKRHAKCIPEFDGQLIRQAITEGSTLLQENQKLFINVHPKTLMRGLKLPEVPINHDRIVFEVTEKTAFTDQVQDELERLQMQGYKLAIDDYGKQYSNLDRLISSWFEPAYLKLDRSFAAALQHVDIAKTVIAYTHKLCEKLGMILIVEGVETAEQQQALDEIGVNCLQGYYLGYPAFADAWRLAIGGVSS